MIKLKSETSSERRCARVDLKGNGLVKNDRPMTDRQIERNKECNKQLGKKMEGINR